MAMPRNVGKPAPPRSVATICHSATAGRSDYDWEVAAPWNRMLDNDTLTHLYLRHIAALHGFLATRIGCRETTG